MPSRTTGSPRNISSTTPTRPSLLRRASNSPRTGFIPDLMPRRVSTMYPRGIMKEQEVLAGKRAQLERVATPPNQPQARLSSDTASRSACKHRLRPHATASALRLSVDEAAVFPLHTRNRRADYRHPEGSVPESCRSVYFSPQRRRHEESRNDHLCGGLDSAYLRNANYPHCRHDSTSARQRR